MNKKSVVSDAEQVQLAIRLIKLGARLQLLESQTTISRERLIKLGAEPMEYAPDAFDAYLRKEIADNAALVKAAGIKPQ